MLTFEIYVKGVFFMNEKYNKDGIVIYNEDNLKVLRSLGEGTVNLIYCDILYNTGKKFDDYNDNLGTPKQAIEWYRPRIEEMWRVLASNGSIFIHCNWRLDSYMRILMDEVFGISCFRNRIYRKHSDERGFVENFDSQMDIILYYVKDPTNFVFKEIKDFKTRVVPLFENGVIKELCHTEMEKKLAEKGKHLLVREKQLQKMMQNGEVKFIDDLPYRITKAKPIGNLWDEPEMLDDYERTKVAKVYDTPKPDAVLERIITMCSNEGDTVADFFMGSGTTAVITKRMNRKGIFCDISEKACAVAISKLEA